MELPKFLIADNDEYPEFTYVIHTEKPRFIVDVDSQEFEILDGSNILESTMQNLIEQAIQFFEDELSKYDDEDGVLNRAIEEILGSYEDDDEDGEFDEFDEYDEDEDEKKN